MSAKFQRLRCGAAALAVAVTLAACGGGGDGGSAPAVDTTPPPATRVPVTVVTKADKSYGAINAGANAKVEVFRKADGSADEALYSNASTGEKVRVFNGGDGLPERVVDEITGTTLKIERVSNERIDFRSYDRAGKYVGGYAVLVKGTALSAAPILGTPAVSGQLVGQLAGAGQSGSFTLLPDANVGLGTPVAFTQAMLDLADATNLPAAPTAVKQKFAGIDGRAVIGGLLFGTAVGIGTATVAPALIAGAMTAWFLQNYGLPIYDGVRGANSLEQMSESLNTFLDRLQTNAPASDALGAALAGTTSGRISGALSRAFDAARDSASDLVDRSTLPVLSARAPAVDTSVSGLGVDQSGVSYNYGGTVQAAGAVTLTGTPGAGGAPIVVNGNLTGTTLTGTMSGRLGNGTVSGATQQLGQCAALQQSGGQGTFSYAFDAGVTSGQIRFYREAFTIPDGFRVVSSGVTLYDTGGLVSGNETVMLALNGSRTVFVTVNAPNNGTAWELRVGCPT